MYAMHTTSPFQYPSPPQKPKPKPKPKPTPSLSSSPPSKPHGRFCGLFRSSSTVAAAVAVAEGSGGGGGGGGGQHTPTWRAFSRGRPIALHLPQDLQPEANAVHRRLPEEHLHAWTQAKESREVAAERSRYRAPPRGPVPHRTMATTSAAADTRSSAGSASGGGQGTEDSAGEPLSADAEQQYFLAPAEREVLQLMRPVRRGSYFRPVVRPHEETLMMVAAEHVARAREVQRATARLSEAEKQQLAANLHRFLRPSQMYVLRLLLFHVGIKVVSSLSETGGGDGDGGGSVIGLEQESDARRVETYTGLDMPEHAAAASVGKPERVDSSGGAPMRSGRPSTVHFFDYLKGLREKKSGNRDTGSAGTREPMRNEQTPQGRTTPGTSHRRQRSLDGISVERRVTVTVTSVAHDSDDPAATGTTTTSSSFAAPTRLHLRGGGSSEGRGGEKDEARPSTSTRKAMLDFLAGRQIQRLDDDQRVPAGLFYLAGGKPSKRPTAGQVRERRRKEQERRQKRAQAKAEARRTAFWKNLFGGRSGGTVRGNEDAPEGVYD